MPDLDLILRPSQDVDLRREATLRPRISMGMPTVTGSEWFITREPVGYPVSLTQFDRSGYLHFGDGASALGGDERTTYGFVLGQRGQANIALNAKAGDNYQPQVGWQVFLYDVTASEQICVFAGSVNKVQTSWWGTDGDRLISLSCVSWEQAFGVIRVPGVLYQNQTAGFIFNDLLSLADGWPGTIGTIRPRGRGELLRGGRAHPQ